MREAIAVGSSDFSESVKKGNASIIMINFIASKAVEVVSVKLRNDPDIEGHLNFVAKNDRALWEKLLQDFSKLLIQNGRH